jgi:rRNA maturation RNase YbeY
MKAQINIETRDLYQFNHHDVMVDWIESVVCYHGFKHSEINYTFYTDEELLEINKTFLNHDFYTDIITFDNSIGKTVSADIAISIDRVKENSKSSGSALEEELKRVMVHGILHCIGFNDKTDDEQAQMRREEDKMLNMFHVEQVNEKDNV